MKTHNGLNRLKEGAAKVTAAVVLGPLALTGCSSAADANRQPTVVASSASVEPSPEVTPTAAPTPEQTFDPSSDTTEIKIGKDVIGNYYEQLAKLDNVMPDILTLADGEDKPVTLTIAADGNSYNVTGYNDDGVKFDTTVLRTNRKITVKFTDGHSKEYYAFTQVLKMDLTDGNSATVISDFGLYDGYSNSIPWKNVMGRTTTDTNDDFNTDPYGVRYLEKQVADYSPGGTNRVGETVEPDQPVTTQTQKYFYEVPIGLSSPEAIATVLVTDQNGNTVGMQVSDLTSDLNHTEARISNLPPAEIAKLAKQYNLAVSFKDPDSLPKDDVELYDILKSSLASLPAPK